MGTNLKIALDYISSSPNLQSKFSDRLEKYLKPRIEEIQSIFHQKKLNKEEFLLDFSKENITDVKDGLSFPSVLVRLSDQEENRMNLMDLFSNAKTKKVKE